MSSGYAFAGYYYTGGYNGGYRAWLVRTDTNGNIKSQKTYGSAAAATQFQKIAPASDGGSLLGDGRSSLTISLKPTL